MDRNVAEFLSITEDTGTPSTYGTDRVVAPDSDFDNLQLILNCDTDTQTRNGCSDCSPAATETRPESVSAFSQSVNSSSYTESGDHQTELPIIQSFSDLEESISAQSPKWSRFLAWFTKKFILPQSGSAQSPQALFYQPETLWSLNYREAAIYLEEGWNNDKFEYHPRAYSKLPAYLTVHNHAYYLLDLAACLLVLSLAIFEKPAVDGFHLSESIHASMELFGLAVIGVVFWIKFHWMGYRYFVRHKRTMIKTIVLGLMITEAIVVLLRQDSHFRVTRSLRPVFLIDNYYFGGVRRVIRQTIQSLRSFMEMLLLQMFFLLFFSISAFYLFSAVPNYEQFSTIWNSFISLFVLLTTSNFPDVMMPAYKQGQLYVLFFVFFLVVNLYFLLNIMLAVVYTVFSQIEKDKFRKLLLHRRSACDLAFRLLLTKNNQDYITFHHFYGLLSYLKPETSLRDRYLMYKTLLLDEEEVQVSGTPSPIKILRTNDRCHSGNHLTIQQFYNIYEVLHLKWRDETQQLPWFETVPCLAPFKTVLHKLRFMVTHRYFTYFTFTIILLATVYQLLDAIFGQGRWEEDVGLPASAATMCAVFIGLYTVECLLKLLALGREYFRVRWNFFDFVITVVALTTFLLARYQVTQSLSTSLFSFRSLRLIDLLRRNVHRYRDILGPFAFIIIKRFTSVTLVVLIVYYFFAIIAMECFGDYNMANCCRNTSIAVYYQTSGIGQYNYYLNNFNDLITSFVTLFELMVVNNWPIIMKSYVIVTGTQLTSIFFMIFFMISLLVVTIVVAFVIDTIQFQIKYQHRFGLETLSAKIQVKVRLTKEELQQIKRAQNADAGSQAGGTFSRLVSSPFPPSWSLLKMIFRGQSFERMHSFNSSHFDLAPNDNAINMFREEIVPTTEPGSITFRGVRYRDKFSYNLRMYCNEIQTWIDNSASAQH